MKFDSQGRLLVAGETSSPGGTTSGGLTDAELRASAVAVTGPLTEAQLRAAALAVSGPLTDAQLRAAALTVNANTRSCVGRETIAIAAAGTASLTVPVGAVAAHIQADGATIRIRLDGTAPTATIGTRLDDGVIYPVDTALANVRLYGVGACNVQVVYFDKA